jgi:hypothetical protein
MQQALKQDTCCAAIEAVMSATTIIPPPLAEGETYIGLIGNAAGEAHHVILLPGDNDEANHEAALEWAKSIGGDLPTRIEQAMLWANHKDLFQKDWYWSNETPSADPAYAWYQYFNYGYQLLSRKDNELRARAVRRLPI